MTCRKQSGGHLPMLDSLRMIAAVWVAMSHGARLPLTHLLESGIAGKVLIALNNGLFNGIAAVMVFFVISGLVIHLPYAVRESIPLREYYARRLIRIVGPAVAAYIVFRGFGAEYAAALEAVLWSIYCEVIYYFVYPAVHALAKKFSMNAVLLVTSVTAAVLLVLSYPTLYYWHLSLPLMALVGFPCWLLGCKLAEMFRDGDGAQRSVSRREIWAWRLAAVALQAALKFPITHGPMRIGAPESHWLFAVFALFWLAREVAYARRNAPPAWFEKLGACTYSLYLVHYPILFAFQEADWQAPALMVWLVQGVCLIAGTWLFFKAVEQPFHELARRAATRPVSHQIVKMMR